MICECFDPGCPNCAGRCRDKGLLNVKRSDMHDMSGTNMCPGCARDALDSGVFRDVDWAKDVFNDGYKCQFDKEQLIGGLIRHWPREWGQRAKDKAKRLAMDKKENWAQFLTELANTVEMLTPDQLGGEDIVNAVKNAVRNAGGWAEMNRRALGQ